MWRKSKLSKVTAESNDRIEALREAQASEATAAQDSIVSQARRP